MELSEHDKLAAVIRTLESMVKERKRSVNQATCAIRIAEDCLKQARARARQIVSDAEQLIINARKEKYLQAKVLTRHKLELKRYKNKKSTLNSRSRQWVRNNTGKAINFVLKEQ